MTDYSVIRICIWSSVGTLFAIAALFFFRFHRDTKDRFFVLFALSFLTLGLHYWLLAALSVPDESKHWLYVVRLVAFALIAAAVADKSRRAD